ncbi:MAG: hypothetical protein RL341_721 [Pseudomonadota bacterium]|jgi:hypothetical protein
MKQFTRATLVAAGLLALSACGGGGSDGGGGSTVPPPSATKTINTSNYLDAAWAGAIGFVRINLAAESADAAFRTALAAGDPASGSFPCQNSGNFAYARSGATRTITFNNCAFTSQGLPIQFAAGTVSTSDAVLGTFGSAAVFNSGSFTYSGVSLNWGAGLETVAGALAQVRQTNGSLNATGTLTVTRNGRPDQYTNISLRTNVPNAAGAVIVLNAAASVSSPRLAFGFNAEGTETLTRSVAADNSAVQATPDATGQTLTYAVFANYSPGATPEFTRALASSDAAVQAAIQRVLQ